MNIRTGNAGRERIGACGRKDSDFKLTGRNYVLGILVLLLVGTLTAGNPKLSEAQRMAILRTFLAERPFVHRVFPRGKAGIRVEGEKVTPSEAEMNQLIAQFGPVAKVGDRVQITAVRFEHGGIIFDINGGATKRKSWRDRISIGANGVDPASSQNAADVYTDSNGSSVFLALQTDAASLTTDQIKDMLSPILDFKTRSVAEAYQKSLPPLLAAAVKNHHALVGMDREMVTYAMGRPPHRVREKDYEEWIYGDPPQKVEFIRFVDDKVIRIEDMNVSGEKVVRTKDEVGDLGGVLDASAHKKPQPEAMARPDAASVPEQTSEPPTLLRPGEKAANADNTAGDSKRDANPKLPQDGPSPSGPN